MQLYLQKDRIKTEVLIEKALSHIFIIIPQSSGADI